MKIAIKKRNRDYGIFTWTIKEDFDVLNLFNRSEKLVFTVDGSTPKAKTISYKYRRFTISKKILNKHNSAEFFVLSKDKNGVKINFE